MKSCNHYAYGAIGVWMSAVVAGIAVDPDRLRYKHSVLRPQPCGGSTQVSERLNNLLHRLISQRRINYCAFVWRIWSRPMPRRRCMCLKKFVNIILDSQVVAAPLHELGAGEQWLVASQDDSDRIAFAIRSLSSWSQPYRRRVPPEEWHNDRPPEQGIDNANNPRHGADDVGHDYQRERCRAGDHAEWQPGGHPTERKPNQDNGEQEKKEPDRLAQVKHGESVLSPNQQDDQPAQGRKVT